MENLIESKLMKNYSTEDINDFYDNFVTKVDDYKKANEAVFDILYSFIDFIEFKKAIIEYKSVY